jgi:hypothetical protein
MLLFLGESMKKLPYFERNCRFWSESVCRLLFICLILTLSPTALGPIGPRVFKGIQLKA